MVNFTCNSTLEELRIGSETHIAGPFTFHQLALIIGGGCAAVAILTSFYLIFRHATNYTKPGEQRHIIRILLMIPIYSASAFLCIWYYWHAVYFQVLSDCYEAFAISSFFGLMCHYIAPDLHDQKVYFRNMAPIQGWVWPINWFAKCCGGERGPWRTPKSGLTWFNIVWIGIYHYCFIRVAMTITAVVTQYYDRYCESSNNPVFAHIWVIVIEGVAVTIAMFCLIQFYIQLKEPLAEHRPFLKVLAIKLVIFLSFWQSAAISVGTSTLGIVKANDVLHYPDLKVGVPSLLLCFEMAVFAILHLWAFPYQPYVPGAKPTFYPVMDPSTGLGPRENEHTAPQGGPMGLMALVDAVNLWDVCKAFGRGLRWLFVGVKHRHTDVSYQVKDRNDSVDTSYPMKTYGGQADQKPNADLPIASEVRRSQFGAPKPAQQPDARLHEPTNEESAGLIEHAQGVAASPPRVDSRLPSPYHHEAPFEAPEPRGGPAAPAFQAYRPYQQPYPEHDGAMGHAMPASPASPTHAQGGGPSGWAEPSPYSGDGRSNPRSSTQVKVGNALWGDRGPPGMAM